MKKILFLIVGLISLLGLLSCDKSVFAESDEFAPACFVVNGESTIKVLGPNGLVIEETEKTDWQLYVQYDMSFIGTTPLEVLNDSIVIDDIEHNSLQLDIETNNEDCLFIALSGLMHRYTYLGNEVMLSCFSPLCVKVKLITEEMEETPLFHQKGRIEYSLVANHNITLVKKEQRFTMASIEYYRQEINNE